MNSDISIQGIRDVTLCPDPRRVIKDKSARGISRQKDDGTMNGQGQTEEQWMEGERKKGQLDLIRTQ